MTDLTIRQIRTMLQGRAGELARQLAPNGIERHGLYEAPNPTRADRKAGSFKIKMRGADAGGWVDYAGVNAPFMAGGDRGDVIDLIAYCVCGRDRKRAIAWAKDWLGLATLSAEERARIVRRSQVHAAQAARKADEDEARRRASAFRIFMNARLPLVDTLVETYLASRSIVLGDVQHLSADLRFNAALDYWRDEKRPRLPALVCAIRDRHGNATAVHCTFLAADGSGKAAVVAPKLMLGGVAGGVIRVAHGPSGLEPERWLEEQKAGAGRAPDLLILTEGVEDALTVAEAVPAARVWAATSLGNLGNVYVDHPCIGAVLVCGDNDWGKGQAEAQFERAVETLEARTRHPVRVVRSFWGKDFNDLARAG
jgi:hypothetical protein